MAAFFGAVVALAGLSYAVPLAEPVRPWLPGEPIPLVHLVTGKQRVELGEPGELVVREDLEAPVTAPTPVPAPVAAPVAIDDQPAAKPHAVARPAAPPLPHRPPAVPTPLEVPPGALDHWFEALAEIDEHSEVRIARALHYGDSSIAGDGIAGTVRARLQERFGDGGPGFVAAHVDARWSFRPGLLRQPEGGWTTHSITHGGAESGAYGLAGTVSVGDPGATSVLGGQMVDGARQRLKVFDVYYQVRSGGGRVRVKPRGAVGATLRTDAANVGDRFRRLEVPGGATSCRIEVLDGGPVTIYGVALETSGPGVTWETFGVAGASKESMLRQGRRHMARQVARRAPDLIAVQLGGNELGHPGLKKPGGGAYATRMREVVDRLRAGAPEASCLIVTPFDKAKRVRGRVESKPTLATLIDLQRKVARETGCAFWDAQHAMGGPGAVARWLQHKPRLALSDLHHLTKDGQALIGDSLADAMLHAFADWRRIRAD